MTIEEIQKQNFWLENETFKALLAKDEAKLKDLIGRHCQLIKDIEKEIEKVER